MEQFLRNIRDKGIPVFDKPLIIEKCIGEGGSGKVYRCLLDNVVVAAKCIKKYNEEYLTSQIENITQEITLVYNLNTKRIVKPKGVCVKDDDIYIIMEYLMYGDLNDYFERKNTGVKTLKQYINMFKSITQSIVDLHKNNIVHGDLKPGNLAYYYDIQKTGAKHKKYIKVFDFNLSTKFNSKDKYIAGWKGTFGYCAPEQHKNKLHRNSDVYSLGVIFLEYLLERYLWGVSGWFSYKISRKETMECLKYYRELHNESDTEYYKQHYNKDLYKIIKKCLCLDPDNRFSSKQLLEELKKIDI